MPWTFVSNWKRLLADMLSGDTITSRRGGIQRNDTGTDYVDTAAFDYFLDTAIAGETLNISSPRPFWGVRFQVGTAIVAAAISLVWEYYNTSGAWVALRVTNPAALLSTGAQDVMFTPPFDWGSAVGTQPLKMRCRIVSLTGLTEGGANATNKVYFDFRPIRATGNLGDLSGAVTADLAGTYATLPATTPAASLTPLEMPVRALQLAARVDIVLVGCTVGAGDTVTLTGISVDGTAVSESIDVSGGPGTYTSVLAYSDITNVACAGFADGTIAVNQKRWGVCHKPFAFYSSYKLRADLLIGDGSTTTSLRTDRHVIEFYTSYMWYVEAAATYNAGQATGPGSSAGSVFIETVQRDALGPSLRRTYGNAIINHRGCMYQFNNGCATQWSRFVFASSTQTVSFTDCVFSGGGTPSFFANGCTLTRCRFYGMEVYIVNALISLTDVATSGNVHMEASGINTVTADGLVFNLAPTWIYSTAIVELIDCPGLVIANILVGYSAMGNSTRQYKVKNRLALRVLDGNGDPVVGADVTVRDSTGATVLATTTNGSGDITATALEYALGSHTSPNNYWDWEYRTPHTVTISKAGYRARTVVVTMDRKREELETLWPAERIPRLQAHGV